MRIEEQMKELIQRLNAASDAYYNGQAELLSDTEWDQLFDKLQNLEQTTGIILSNSPTHKVSADTVYGQKEEHLYPALSLAKTKSVSELVKWANGKKIWMSWKLDGLTLVVTYQKGKLLKIVTRGDGHIGTNITHLAQGIFGIPEHIDYQGELVIRGEALISYADFEQYIRETGEDYANPRNLAAGSLNLKKAQEVKRRNIHFRPFTLVYIDQTINCWGERMKFLTTLGFDVVEHICLLNSDEEHMQNAVEQFSKQVMERVNPYPVDGLVIVYDDILYAQKGNVTGHHATRAGLAFKWKDQSKITKLIGIEWSNAISTISPIALFEPIELEGTSVKRASLVNISECERLGIGDKGTVLEVIKANMIIPKILSVKQKVGQLVIPEKCPVCHAKTSIQISKVSGTKTLKCSNDDCPAKALKQYVRFVSKQGVDIEGINEATLARFIACGWIHSYADIYHLERYKDEIAQLDGFGEKSAFNIISSLIKAKKVRADKFLVALSIPLVGIDVARRLLKAYSFNELWQLAMVKEKDFLASIEGIGPQKSASFINFVQDPRKQEEVKKLLAIIEIEDLANNNNNSLAGLTFVITGELRHFPNRSALKELIQSQGGKVTSSISKATSFLINNDVNSTSTKNKKAKELAIPIISEAELCTRFNL